MPLDKLRKNVVRAGTQSIERTSLVLRLIAANQRSGLSLTEIADRTQLEVPTAHRMLKCLVDERLVERGVADRRYKLGSLTLELGLAAMHQSTLIERARPVVERIALETGDTVYLVARSGDESVCLTRREGSFPIKTLILEVGGRRPLGIGGASLHILCQYSDEEVEGIITRNERTYGFFHNVNAEILRKAVVKARMLGHGMSCDRQIAGVTAVGIALPSRHGIPCVGIGVAAITSRMDDGHRQFALERIRDAIKDIGELD
jgi:DNA-binding IclR family transcriptional regulator